MAGSCEEKRRLSGNSLGFGLSSAFKFLISVGGLSLRMDGNWPVGNGSLPCRKLTYLSALKGLLGIVCSLRLL